MPLDPNSAERLIGEHLACLPIESLPVAQCAGAVLRENVYAERDQPPFDRVSMDGIAVHSGAGVQRFRVQATQGAGAPPLTLGAPDQCIEVISKTWQQEAGTKSKSCNLSFEFRPEYSFSK